MSRRVSIQNTSNSNFELYKPKIDRHCIKSVLREKPEKDSSYFPISACVFNSLYSVGEHENDVRGDATTHKQPLSKTRFSRGK